MDSNLTVRPRDGVSRAGYGRTNAPVRTELTPSQSVTPAAQITATNNTATPAGTIAREAVIDPQNQEVINHEREQHQRRGGRRAPDESTTGETMADETMADKVMADEPAPDELLSRMRAYNRTMAKSESGHDPQADLEV